MPSSTTTSTIVVTGVAGLAIALDANALDPSPEWTRLDNQPGVTVSEVTIKRGRPDEREKTAIGELTASGIDQTGILDPTNRSGPFWAGDDTQLDPVKQIAFAVWNPITGVWWTRYVGYLDELEYELDISGKFARFTLSCVDALDLLTDAEVVPDAAGNPSPHESAGYTYYEPAQFNARILAALADAATAVLEQAWPPARLRIFSGNEVLQGKSYSPGEPIMSVIDEACDAEFPGAANRFVDRLGVFTVHGRYARFHPNVAEYGIGHWKLGDIPATTLDSDVAMITQPFKFTRGKTNLINAALTTPAGIKQDEIAGQLVADTASIGKYGPRSVSFPDLITLRGDEGGPLDANDETKLVSQYYVDNFKKPQNRPGTITVKASATDRACDPAIWAFVCGVDLSDLAHLTTTHLGGGGGFDADFFVEGLTETHTPRKGEEGGDIVEMQLDVSPRAYFDTNPFSGDTRTG